ncbi:GNAT family N-acetyltransferase [Mobilicoccus massiliensis]|uniref:GNAT family N-acetyltransferase n=1 Tax=Mobilicoccus massiliensis TaxID=1522310 RepID=UPI00058C26DA|nr:GNAT family protein [Mobilicoccus massiliensis]
MTPSHPWPKTVDDVLLRDPTEADIDVIAGFRNLPAVNRWTLLTHEAPDDLRRRWVGVASSDTDFSCVAEVDGELAGIGFLEIGNGMGQPGMPPATEAGIGYIVRPGFEGRGVGTAIARGLVEAALVDLGLHRVTAGCFADNHASVRILEKAGLLREQHGRADSWHDELGWIDGYTYGALRDDWLASRA